MGNLKICVILLLISSVSPLPQQQKLPQHTSQQRPTRTLGSLFGGGSKPSPPPVQPPPPHQSVNEQQKSLNSIPQPLVGGGGVRPLVYQVKYYDRIQNNLIDYPDGRNYNPIDKAGVVLDQQPQQQVIQGVQYQGGQGFGQPPIIPPRYYYNPLIPPIQEPIVYTIANIGNTQVLIPCSTQSTDQLIYDSTIALNVEQPVVQAAPSLRVPVTQQQTQHHVQIQPPVPNSLPNRTPLLPPSTVQQPLIREQVVAAAAELSALNALPGSALVGANVNSHPYTQGSYFYYYLLPGNNIQNQQAQVIDQQRVQNPYPLQNYQNYQNLINPYSYRYNQGVNPVIPVVLSGYQTPYQTPYQTSVLGNQHLSVYPQPSNQLNTVLGKERVVTQQGVQQQNVGQVQGQQQVSQQQQQQQQVKG